MISSSLYAGTSTLDVDLTLTGALHRHVHGVMVQPCRGRCNSSLSRLIDALCFLRKSSPSIPLEVMALTTTHSTGTAFPSNSRVSDVLPCVWSGVPSALTNSSAVHGASCG